MVDSYRPSRPERDRPPPLADRMTFNGGARDDNYRPAQSDFTFESSHQGPRFPPAGPAADGGRAPARNQRGKGRGRGNGRNDHQGRSNANGRGRGRAYRKPATHERALLSLRDAGSPERAFGIEGPSRFMNLDDMSQGDDAEMDESDMSAGGNDSAEALGEALGDAKAVQPAVSKWSNPDPYTALPPPSETTGVKKDVVQLIRKAKNQEAEKAAAANAVAANDDFISFGDDDDGEDGEVDEGPSMRIYEDEEPIRRRDDRRDDDDGRGKRRRTEGPGGDMEYIASHIVPPQQDSYRPPQDAYPTQRVGGGRKRRYDDSMPIVDEWMRTRNGNPSPWVERADAYKHLEDKPGRWLHNEILDFYDFVAPQSYEHRARDQLVQRIKSALSSQKFFPHDKGLLLSFGSYPAGLYLPTADMDLVYTSERHYNGGPPLLDATIPNDRPSIKKTLYKCSRRLQQVGIANNPVVIPSAKVPIVKFKDRVTGLDVDISFENLSGVQAQATFQKWKEQFPDMVYMVALVKQLLVMRAMNEVHSGGLGGFTIICLIISFLQHSKKADNLGDCFIAFLKYYGKDFDLSRQRIQMSPPAVVKKSHVGIDGRPEKPTGLSIQDPNKPENNISGGSHKAPQAFQIFADAFDTITDCVDRVHMKTDIGSSILACILGGNYSSYIDQRRIMRSLKKRDYKQIDKQIELAQATYDDWAQVLHWMDQMQTMRVRTARR